MPVMVLEKKTDKKGAEIGCLAPCYLCERTKGRCTVGSGGGGKEVNCQTEFVITQYFSLSWLSQEI